MGCTGADVSPPPSSPPSLGAGAQSIAGDEREVVALERGARGLADELPRVGADPRDERAVTVGVLEHRVAERGLEAREQLDLHGVRFGLGLRLRFGLGRRRRPRPRPRPASSASGVGVGGVVRQRSRLRCRGRRRSAGAAVTGIVRAVVHDDRLAAPALRHVVVADALVLDALLQDHDRLEQRFGPRRATGHVHVDRDDLVDALGHRVRVPVRTTAVRARTHRDHVLRVGHLLVEPTDRRRHLVGDGAGDHDEVGLARARRERDHAEAHHVVARARQRGGHLDRAAREAPLEHPEGVLAAVVEEPGEGLGQESLLD